MTKLRNPGTFITRRKRACYWYTYGSGISEQPLETPDWKTRDVGSMQLVRFRLGKGGHILELQIPLLINGKPAY